jgi:hypothetical protein
LYTVLDPLTMELATPAGLTGDRAKLPWADSRPHSPGDFDSKKVDRCARLIADYINKNEFNSVLAPTHYLIHGVNDQWFLIDRRLTLQLRRELDDIGCRDVAICYPLAVPTSVFFDANQRRRLIAALENLHIDGIWLRVHRFGSHSGGINLQKYLLACRDFHFLKLPRVYIPSLEIFLKRDEAIEFFKNPKLRQYGCRDNDCCHRGYDSMISDPRRHFTFTRMEEVASLSAMPERIRATGYLQQMLRPADESLGRVLGEVNKSSLLLRPLEKRGRRLHGWRKTLTKMNSSYPAYTFSPALNRRIIHIRATA